MERERPYRQVLEQLRAAKLRPTRQRMALAKLLFDGENRHVTAEMLHGEAVQARVQVSLATVYNTLHQFTDAGLLREIVVEPGRSYFDTNMSAHHHFFQEDTSQLVDIDGAQIDIGTLPEPPAGTSVNRVDVIVRVQRN
jgi:Fur family iron response transcriptional regulator